jgi:hypothetical protein
LTTFLIKGDNSMATRGVVYVMIGDAEDVWLRMAVSMRTLERHWKGPVALITNNWERVGNHEGLTVVRYQEPIFLQHPGHFVKAQVGALSPFEETVFLDCDTLVTGNFTELFPTDERLVLTQVGDGFARVKVKRDLFAQMMTRGFVHPSWVDRLRTLNAPDVNTGTFGVSWSWGFSRRWADLTAHLDKAGVLLDEGAIQLIMPEVPYRLVDDRFNRCVFLFTNQRRRGRRQLSDEQIADTRIWHSAGNNLGLLTTRWCEELVAAWDADYRWTRACCLNNIGYFRPLSS